ncbi:OmpA family protein [Paracrocinitomix mangrovi]|uniref:OmpA family protein n=1 Tax=Paracrocinitomix mangrovi TaxID=2862509 RepID=UPI001C8D8FE7|nr:OmpA family protein [Paracrocinitomix mangrovi]UKN01454.1 OmpA family protein [Paracrocinitomix mangrovi]
MKNLLTILFVALIASCSMAQPGKWNTKNKKAIKLVEAGMDAAHNAPIDQNGRLDFSDAINYFDKAIAKDPNFTDAYILKAEYSMRGGDPEAAIQAYHTLIAIPTFTTSTGYVYYDLANLEFANGMYKEALEHAQKYATYRTAPDDMKQENQWIILNSEFAIEAMKNPVPFDPVNVGSGVNTYDPEYFPTLTVDQNNLLFTRRVTNERTGQWQEDFFISENDNGYWKTGEPMPTNINTSFNEGAPTFAPDGKTLIFVGCAVERVGYGGNRRGYGSCDLFITQKVGTKWLDPINLPGMVNTKHWETQPSLSSDGKTLYFIRGQIRGTGGRAQRNGDIYMSKLQEDGSWGEAEKLPDNINTKYSESSCLIHPDGKTLYFSSNGHIGMGGYDLYMTQLQPDGSWSDPVNLGYPINTHHDENSLLVFADGKLAVFASDRPGGLGSLDLYQFVLPETVRPTKTIYMTGTVFDIVSRKKLGAEFSLKDLETGEEVVRSYSDPMDGSFLVSLPINKKYALFVNKEGYHPYTVNFDLVVPENSEEPYHMDVPLTPLSQPTSGEIALANVFFDLDSDKLRPESFLELNAFAAFLKANPKMKIELQGHTDSQGDDAHNMTLSQGRAKSVYNYLVQQGVDAKQLTHKGYGETRPSTFTDASGNEVKRTEEWINALPTDKAKKDAHQQNRRTVYIVLEN